MDEVQGPRALRGPAEKDKKERKKNTKIANQTGVSDKSKCSLNGGPTDSATLQLHVVVRALCTDHVKVEENDQKK